jgi:thioredoxin reductase
VTEREIMAVPMVFLNGTVFGSGRMLVEEILAKIDTGAAVKDAAKLSQKEAFDVLIVGGGPAGAAAGVYAARKGIRTGIVAERFGGQTNDTLGIENYPSVLETDGPKFAAALEAHTRFYDVEIMNLQQAQTLVPAAAPGGLIEVKLANGATLKSKTVILSTGARWRNVNVPGEAEYKNKGVAYCPHCDGPLFKGKDVAVIGGGNSGVEAAIDLAGVVRHVTVVEFMPELKADAVLVKKLKSLSNVTVHTNAQTTAITGVNAEGVDIGKVTGMRYKDPRHQRRAPGQPGRRVCADRPGAQHGVAQGHVGTQQVWRDHRQRQGRNQCAWRVCCGRLHHRSVQADRHRRRGWRQGCIECIRSPDPALRWVGQVLVVVGRRYAWTSPIRRYCARNTTKLHACILAPLFAGSSR